MSAEATTSNARLSSYPIMVVREGTNNLLIAKVNFDEKYELLFCEIRYLKWLGFERDIPKTVSFSFCFTGKLSHCHLTLCNSLHNFAAYSIIRREPLSLSTCNGIERCAKIL